MLSEKQKAHSSAHRGIVRIPKRERERKGKSRCVQRLSLTTRCTRLNVTRFLWTECKEKGDCAVVGRPRLDTAIIFLDLSLLGVQERSEFILRSSEALAGRANWRDLSRHHRLSVSKLTVGV